MPFRHGGRHSRTVIVRSALHLTGPGGSVLVCQLVPECAARTRLSEDQSQDSDDDSHGSNNQLSDTDDGLMTGCP